ncbi:MAG: metal ABC transporter permease [Ruminococcaceae bacterium]|nr:metal ABC transporter permease [Oscillospiraceae bacterium]
MSLDNLYLIKDFYFQAFVVGVLISACTAMLGVEVVLKKYSMLGDGLSHVSFGTLAVAASFGSARLEVALVVVVFVAFLLLQIRQNSKINGDAAVAIVSGSFMAIGIFATRLENGSNTDYNSYLTGSLFAINDNNFLLCVVLSITVIVVYIMFYNKIFAVTFDENFSSATGGKVGVYNFIIASLTAVSIVVGMRLIGALLISSLTVFPVVSSLRLAKTYKSCVLLAIVASVVAYIGGFVLSLCAVSIQIPVSSAIIFCNLIVLAVCYIFSSLRKRGKLVK